MVNRLTGTRRNGTSEASRSNPRGNIHAPRRGRNENKPPKVRRTPVGMRTQRDAG